MFQMNDGLLELIAIDNLDLAILHAGGSGLCVTRCKSVTMTTRTPVPMQIDGEPCFMQPCRIEISHKSQGKMLARNKKATCKRAASEIRDVSQLVTSNAFVALFQYTTFYL